MYLLNSPLGVSLFCSDKHSGAEATKSTRYGRIERIALTM